VLYELLGYVALNEISRMFIKDETGRMREEAAMANLRHWTVGTEKF
jgi:hypothetical protein